MASNLGEYYLTRKEALDDTFFPRSPVGMHTKSLRKLASHKTLIIPGRNRPFHLLQAPAVYLS